MATSFEVFWLEYKSIMRDLVAGTETKRPESARDQWLARQVRLDFARKILERQPNDTLLESVLAADLAGGYRPAGSTKADMFQGAIAACDRLDRTLLKRDLDSAFAEFQRKRSKR